MDATPANAAPELKWKLWIYTNYDCNLRCAYCLAESSPTAPRRAIGLENVRCLVDEAVDLGFTDVFFTGGEPLLLDEIYAMLEYATVRVRTTLLTNAILLRGVRLAKLAAVANDNLIVQVSLDGARAEEHDAYRGARSWAKTVAGITALQATGFRVRISTTETPANAAHLAAICAFHHGLGIPEEDHFIRPLARRGFSTEGYDLDMASVTPELTVNSDGVFWHPLSTDADMRVSKTIFPLAAAVARVQDQLDVIARTGVATPMTFT
ncbi:MAG: radical SAM protein [Chloroflexales bacterium]